MCEYSFSVKFSVDIAENEPSEVWPACSLQPAPGSPWVEQKAMRTHERRRGEHRVRQRVHGRRGRRLGRRRRLRRAAGEAIEVSERIVVASPGHRPKDTNE